MPVERLIAAQSALPPPDVNAPYEFRPVVDGVTLPLAPLEAYVQGETPDVPLMIGTTRDEHTRTLHLVTTNLLDFVSDDAEARRLITDLLGDHTDEVVSAYRKSRPSVSPTDLYVAVTTDLWARIPAITIAEQRVARGQAPVFMYLFEWHTPHYAGGLRATHGLDVPFALDNIAAASLTGGGADAVALAHAMSEAWLAFIRTGNPSHLGAGSWPPYSVDSRSTMVFGNTCRVEEDPSAEERRIWATVPQDLLGGYQIPGVFTAH
jgi:para-nitrobenzyl esterase